MASEVHLELLSFSSDCVSAQEKRPGLQIELVHNDVLGTGQSQLQWLMLAREANSVYKGT